MAAKLCHVVGDLPTGRNVLLLGFLLKWNNDKLGVNHLGVSYKVHRGGCEFLEDLLLLEGNSKVQNNSGVGVHIHVGNLVDLADATVPAASGGDTLLVLRWEEDLLEPRLLRRGERMSSLFSEAFVPPSMS